MDSANKGDGSDFHLVIYGHNMRDKSMFGTLSLFEDPAYCAAHPIIRLNLRGEETQWVIFSVFTADDAPERTVFVDDADFSDYVDTLSRNALYDPGTPAAADAPILTLSTCARDSDTARFTIHAQKIS